MKFKIVENFELDEAQFRGYYHLLKHFDKHVLHDGEDFDYNDPKFDPMTKEEYAKAAQELSEMPAEPVLDENDLRRANRGVIGWMAYDPRWGENRFIKINLNSPHKSGHIEIVGYKEKPGDDQIFTYMLARPGKKYREFGRKVGELPENEEKVKKMIADREAKKKEKEQQDGAKVVDNNK